ncbi:MAG: TRAP transporter small permease [Oscillospiraceae bacterium]|nr:TRAP transporter small permease [Oscillospiraceae bacterium]
MAILRWLDKNAELAFSSIMLVLMVLCVSLQVVGRYVMKVPNPWTEEASRYMFVYMVFASIGICARRSKHIRITIMHSLLPKRLIPYLDIFSDLCFAILGWVCMTEGYRLMLVLKSSNQASSSMQWFKMWALYAIVPIGFALLLVRLLQCIIENIKKIIVGDQNPPEQAKEADA